MAPVRIKVHKCSNPHAAEAWLRIAHRATRDQVRLLPVLTYPLPNLIFGRTIAAARDAGPQQQEGRRREAGLSSRSDEGEAQGGAIRITAVEKPLQGVPATVDDRSGSITAGRA